MAMQDIAVDGYRIPRGTTLIAGVYAVHRDPHLWADPLTFDPRPLLRGELKIAGPLAIPAVRRRPAVVHRGITSRCSKRPWRWPPSSGGRKSIPYESSVQPEANRPATDTGPCDAATSRNSGSWLFDSISPAPATISLPTERQQRSSSWRQKFVLTVMSKGY
jgi:hypothetical protein